MTSTKGRRSKRRVLFDLEADLCPSSPPFPPLYRCDSLQPSCSTCTRRAIECRYPEERRFRGPGRKKQPQPNIHLNPDGSVRSDPLPTSEVNDPTPHLAHLLPTLHSPNDPNQNPPPTAPPRKPRKTKKQKLAEEAEAAAALAQQQSLQDEQQQQGMEELQHHLLHHHQQQQLQNLLANGNGDGAQQEESQSAAALMAEALDRATSLGGMAGLSVVMSQVSEGGEGGGDGPEGEYPRPDGEEQPQQEQEQEQELGVEESQHQEEILHSTGQPMEELGERQVDEEMAQPPDGEGGEEVYVEHLEEDQDKQQHHLDLGIVGEEERVELAEERQDESDEVEAGMGERKEEDA